MKQPSHRNGFTLVEVLLTLVMSALLITGVVTMVNRSIDSGAYISRQNQLQAEAHLAMRRMVESVQRAERLFVPQADNPATMVIAENLRSEQVPPSGSGTAVLAISLDRFSDVNLDGDIDRDNDQDGNINEDPPADWNNDQAPGIFGVDDDGDGTVDEGNIADDDEDGSDNEDPVDGEDNDGDGRIDEDPGADVNGDGCAGLCGVDDDGDGFVDEIDILLDANDDEDFFEGEDWHDTKVFYISNGELIERTPVDYDATGLGGITGRDYVEETLSERISLLTFERLPVASGEQQRLRIVLRLRNDDGEEVQLETTTRLGSEL